VLHTASGMLLFAVGVALLLSLNRVRRPQWVQSS
jgi:hypothetical protein